jgi:hypothetical protein
MEVVVYSETMRSVLSLMDKLIEWDETVPDLRVFGRIELMNEMWETVGWVANDDLGTWVFIPRQEEPKQ